MSGIMLGLSLSHDTIPILVNVQDTVAITVTDLLDGTFEIVANDGLFSINVTQPPALAGSYQIDTTLLDAGPLNLLAPRIAGILRRGETLSAEPGLWVYNPAYGIPTVSYQWHDGAGLILGEIAHTYTPPSAMPELQVQETLSQPAYGTRMSGSAFESITL